MNHPMPRSQRGATLFVGLIMLVLITLMVITAMNVSTANFKAVGNMQFRDQAIAAADIAVEQILSSSFTDAPAAEDVDVDLDNNGTTDYVVHVATPRCVRAAVASPELRSSLSLPATMSTSSNWNTTWEIDATVTGSENATGAQARVRSGVRVLLSQTQKDAVCP